jgi:transcriptional regulator with XRE-family HTH domain
MSGDLEKQIGASVAAARERAGLSQAALAERVSLHETSLSNIERGEKLPTIRTLLKIADALGQPMHNLLPAGSASPSSRKRVKREAEVRELVGTMPDKMLDVAYDVLAALRRLD